MFLSPAAFCSPVVLYLRVSSDKQAERETIDGQRYAIQMWCAREGVTIIAEYIDEGVNSDLPWSQRPAALRLLADARAGKIGTILVYMYDRFSRDVFEGLLAARQLAESGSRPFSTSEPYDINTPMGAYMFVNSLNNAQLVKAQFLERTANGSRYKASRGQFLGGKAPFGYRIVGKGIQRHIEPDRETILPGLQMTPAEAVVWIFTNISSRAYSIMSMAEHLQAIGVPMLSVLNGYVRTQPTRDGRPRAWNSSTILNILHSTTYKGIWQYGKTSSKGIIESPCEALVSEELWQRTQDALRANLKNAKRNTRHEYLLRGLMRCGVCGSSYCGRTFDLDAALATGGAKGVSYICLHSTMRRDKPYERCLSPTVPGSAEQVIWQEIVGFLTDPKRVGVLIRELAFAKQDPDAEKQIAQEISRIEAALSTKAGERYAILTLFRRGMIDESMLNAQFQSIDTEEKILKDYLEAAQARACRAERSPSKPCDIAAMIAQVAAQCRPQELTGVALPFETRRVLVEHLVESIKVEARQPDPASRRSRPEADLTVIYRFDRPADDNRLIAGQEIQQVMSF